MSQSSLRGLRGITGIGAVLVCVAGLGAADAKPRLAVGKCITETGTILRRPAGSTRWEVVKKGDPIFSGDLNVGLPGAMIESANGAVRIALLADLDGTSPFPVLESAVILHPGGPYDLDFTLDRGRVDVTSRKEQGQAKVQLRFHKEDWDLVLEPRSRVAVELYGRWPAGVYCDLKQPVDKQECPTAALVVMVLEGELLLDHDDHKHAMRAPPGPAYFQWDSVVEEDTGPRRLDKLPEWADPAAPLSPLTKQKLARLEMFRLRAAAASPDQAIDEALASGDFGYRRLGVVALGATDQVGRLIDVLADPKAAPDTREAAVLVLRHWLGRCRGQDPKLYDVLTKEKRFSPAHAELVLHGLHSFGEAELSRPETYEALIAYLMHDQQVIRELAHWHLVRLVPLGKAIPYDATAAADARKEAHDRWKKLIPDGQLPPRQKLKGIIKDIKEKLKPEKE